MTLATGQEQNKGQWHQLHQAAQAISGKNIGVSVTTSWTDVLILDIRETHTTGVTFYNADGTTGCEVRVIGSLLDKGDAPPSWTSATVRDNSWVDTAGTEIYCVTALAATTKSDFITTPSEYAWVRCQAKSDSGTILVSGYHRDKT